MKKLILLIVVLGTSCEKEEVGQSCTYSSKPPFMPASIRDPSPEDLFFFRRDWGGDNLKVECVKL